MATSDLHHELASELALPSGPLTEAEFERWAFAHDVRAEWVEGEIQIMSPVSSEHLDLAGWLLSVLRVYVDAKSLGAVRGSEYSVRLRRDLRRMPDVFFVQQDRLHVFKRTYLDGPPDVAVEIVSADSVARDYREKYEDYRAAGVPEYWILDQVAGRCELNHLNEHQKYTPLPETDGRIHSRVVPGFYLRPAWINAAQRPDTLTTLRELGVI